MSGVPHKHRWVTQGGKIFHCSVCGAAAIAIPIGSTRTRTKGKVAAAIGLGVMLAGTVWKLIFG